MYWCDTPWKVPSRNVFRLLITTCTFGSQLAASSGGVTFRWCSWLWEITRNPVNASDRTTASLLRYEQNSSTDRKSTWSTTRVCMKPAALPLFRTANSTGLRPLVLFFGKNKTLPTTLPKNVTYIWPRARAFPGVSLRHRRHRARSARPVDSGCHARHRSPELSQHQLPKSGDTRRLIRYAWWCLHFGQLKPSRPLRYLFEKCSAGLISGVFAGPFEIADFFLFYFCISFIISMIYVGMLYKNQCRYPDSSVEAKKLRKL